MSPGKDLLVGLPVDLVGQPRSIKYDLEPVEGRVEGVWG